MHVDLTLNELEAEKVRINDEILRVYCSRKETDNRTEKISRLAGMRNEIEDGIKAFRCLKLGQILQIRG